MKRTRLLEILVGQAAVVIGKPITEVAKLLADEHGSDDILDRLGIDYGHFSRIIDNIERELGVLLPLDLLDGVNSRNDLLDALARVMGGQESEDDANPVPVGEAMDLSTAIDGGLVRKQIAGELGQEGAS